MGRKSNKLDLNYIVKVVTMNEVLAEILPRDDPSLGEKYMFNGENIWSNTHFEKIKEYAEYNKPQSTTFKFDLGNNNHMRMDRLFQDDVVKLRFYSDAKRGKVVDNDNDE